jgi:putative phosphoesterase
LLAAVHQSIDAVFHLGDNSIDILPFIKMYPDLRFCYISGNCDFSDDVPDVLTVTVNNRKIWMLHGHTHSVKTGYDKLTYAAEERLADVCLFGHTHMPARFEHNGIWYMNPGSIGEPRGADVPSYGVLEISDAGEIECRIVGVYGGKRYRPLDF